MLQISVIFFWHSFLCWSSISISSSEIPMMWASTWVILPWVRQTRCPFRVCSMPCHVYVWIVTLHRPPFGLSNVQLSYAFSIYGGYRISKAIHKALIIKWRKYHYFIFCIVVVIMVTHKIRNFGLLHLRRCREGNTIKMLVSFFWMVLIVRRM